MKRTLLSVFFFCLLHSAYGQKRFDVGGFGGLSYYMGDINQYQLFYSPATSFGGIVDYSFSSRYYLRLSVYDGAIGANDKDFENDYQSNTRKASFSASLTDLSLQLGFNFLPYNSVTKQKNNYSFFVSAGLGYTFVGNSENDISPHITIPFGGGIKYNLFERLTVGMEWTYRKTFKDNVDGVESWSNSEYQSSLHNFDWYSFGGLFFTYKLYNPVGNCPAYWDN
ncbi:MAG: DUF6089 family protein [Bacteroidota bacterium]